jgi:hypothetical protein
MTEAVKAKEPFQFYDRLHLPELTGLKAANLHEFVQLLKLVPDSCIYHHTHQFLQQHQYLSPEPPNDFAYWVTEVLGDGELGEILSSINTVQFPTIRTLREKMITAVEEHLKNKSSAQLRFASEADEFHFVKSVSFIFPINYIAHDLQEFFDIIQKVSGTSIYFHMFEARLRMEKETNDFAFWLSTSVGDKQLADKISRLDPYTYTLEDLRSTITGIIKWKLPKQPSAS